MFGDDERRVGVVVQIVDEIDHPAGLGRVHPRGRFVQQDDRRVGAQRQRDLHLPHVAVRKVRTPGVGHLFEARQFEHASGLRVELVVAGGDRGDVEGPAVAANPGDADVLQHRQALEDVVDLERPRESEPVDLERLHPRHVDQSVACGGSRVGRGSGILAGRVGRSPAIGDGVPPSRPDGDASLRGHQLAGEQVVEGGLPRAVGAYDAGDVRVVYRHAHVVNGDERAELPRQVRGLKHGRHVTPPPRPRTAPAV